LEDVDSRFEDCRLNLKPKFKSETTMASAGFQDQTLSQKVSVPSAFAGPTLVKSSGGKHHMGIDFTLTANVRLDYSVILPRHLFNQFSLC
jgi:hypothetical protein